MKTSKKGNVEAIEYTHEVIEEKVLPYKVHTLFVYL